jgi:hypothetical protein
MKTARIYRIIELSGKLEKNNLGVSWSFDMKAAEDFAHNMMMDTDNCILISAVVNFDQIDWEQTTANMQISDYEEEFECFLKTNENIQVEVIWAGSEVEQWEDEQFHGNTGNDEKEDETRACIEDVTEHDIDKLQNELLEWIETE